MVVHTDRKFFKELKETWRKERIGNRHAGDRVQSLQMDVLETADVGWIH